MDFDITVDCQACGERMSSAELPQGFYRCLICEAEVYVKVKVIHKQVIDYPKENAAGQKFYDVPPEEDR